MDQVLKIVQSFPLLVPTNDFKVWTGITCLEDEEVPVTVSTPYFPLLNDFSVLCPEYTKKTIQDKLKHYHCLAEDRNNNNLLHLLKFLKNKDTVGNGDSSEDSLWTRQHYQHYTRTLGELKLLGREAVVFCSEDLLEVTLRVNDARGVEHRLVVSLRAGKPSVTDVDLPQVAITQLNQAETIVEIYNIFRTLIDLFQDFWNTYDSLIRNTWVIDPEHPCHKDTHCRIVISENVSMIVLLNPQDVNTCPEIKVLGPEAAVVPFISTLESKIKADGWDEESSMLANLQTLLDLKEWPCRNAMYDAIEVQGQCDICFQVRLDESDHALPTKVCNNSKCPSSFHITCLVQWFQSVPTNETSFNLISGDCPSCGERVLCPIKMG